MSHAAFIALINNQCFAPDFNETLETFTNNSEQVSVYLINLLAEFLKYVSEKYNATFRDNHWSAIILFVIILFVIIINSVIQISIIKNYQDYLKYLQDEIQYLNSKIIIQEGTLEFALDRNASNELKLVKLIKQMKKLQKEVNEYA